MRHTRWLLLASSIALVFAFASACGGDDSNDTGGGDTPTAGKTSTTGSGEFTYVLTEAPSDAAPPEDQKLAVNVRGEPDTIDPQLASYADSISVAHMLFAGLITFDDDMNLQPLVAKELPTQQNGGISQDGLTYTFKLRDDVKWSDGKTLTASDFEYAIKRLFDPAVGAYYASLYTSIVGAEELYSAAGATPDQVKTMTAALGVKALDDTTLEIKLAEPVATLVQRMALHAVYPVRQDIVEAHPDDWTDPSTIVVNGPYTLTEWAHQDHFTLKANPNFFLGEPVLKEITMIMQPDTNVALASYRADELSTSQVPPAAIQEVKNTQQDELHQGPTLLTFAIDFNNKEAPFDDVNVRKAFAAAFDRDAYVTGVLQGVGVPAITWMPPGIPGYQEDVGIPFDADKAKEYLAQSTKYPNGQGIGTIKFTAADDTQNQLIAEYVKAQAKDVLGIDVNIEILESSAFEEAYNTSNFQMAFSGWGADYPDPDNWIPAQFHTGGSLNHYQYSNAQVDDLVDQAAVELDNDKRISLYQQAQKIIMVDDAGIAPLDHSEVFHLVKPNVHNWHLHPLDAQIPGDYSYQRVYIAK